ncbi:uncharacterized protein UTRI_05853 [Ustilago trichophora]|uniref:Uncharacterized protein n=1 Tax=Ustilago trichophora TaxID=86804 RepID=A0A5C3EH53_9BASI|nr:uncharacterized protein UTRI_05853 [Ustilago trichophora]
MPTYFLMTSTITLIDPLDEILLTEWFPLHSIHEGIHRASATAFYIAQDGFEVLEVLLKAQLLLGVVYLLPEAEFIELLGGHQNDGPIPITSDIEMRRNQGRAISVLSWRQRLQREMEEEAAGVNLESEMEDFVTAEEDESDDAMPIDSDSDNSDCNVDDLDDETRLLANVRMEEYKASNPYDLDEDFLDTITLLLCEKHGIASGSSAGCLI